MVGFVGGDVISGTSVLEHKETPGLGDKMDKSKADWANQFDGINLNEFKLKVTKDGGQSRCNNSGYHFIQGFLRRSSKSA